MAGPIRQPIDLGALSRYLESSVPVISLPLDVKQFGFGQSNPTYLLTGSDGNRYVLRKKPPGRLLSKTAHQVEREYRVIHALEHTGVPVPKTYCLCEDSNILGTPFYLMEFLDGRIIEDASFPNVTSLERTEMWRDAIRTLAKLHEIDPSSVGLANYGKSSGFYNRQIKTLGAISVSQAQAVDVDTHESVGKIPHFEDTVSFFTDQQNQPQDRGTLIHGDYKIDNLVYHKTEPRVIGILDWEMSTIGHPLSDLSNLLHPYTFASSPLASRLIGNTALSAFMPRQLLPGLPQKSRLLAWYAEIAGWDPGPESKWGDAFGVFRNSVIMQGIKARLALKQATSTKAKDHADRMDLFGEFAWLLAREAKQSGSKSRL